MDTGLRRADTRSFIAAVALFLIAIAWWSGLFGPNNAPVPGGFGTLFAVVAFICLVAGVFARRRRLHDARARDRAPR